MSLEQTAIFALTCLGFGFIPGPALLQTVSLTLEHGRRVGLLSAMGIHAGAFLQICVVALGAVAILKASPLLYAALKVMGGAYLIWLGVQRIRMRYVEPNASVRMPSNVLLSSALIEASNPKSALFYFSFLVQFTDPTASIGLGWQLFLLGACANLLFSAADIFCILLAHPLKTRIAPGGDALRLGQPLAGALFIVLGLVAIIGD